MAYLNALDKDFRRPIISGALSNTLDSARTFLPKSATPVVPLQHFSLNAKKWAVLKSLSKRSVSYYNEILTSSSPLPPPAVSVMVCYTISNAPYTRGHYI